MTDDQRHPSFVFHVTDREPGAHNVPASVLVNLLQRAQHAFELIGLQVEGRDIRSRARIPAAISQRFQLMCELPKAGSYAMPITVGDGGELFDAQQAQQAFGIFCEVLVGVSNQDAGSITRALPNPNICRRVLENIREMAPRADSRWSLAVHDAEDRPFVSLDARSARFVDETLVPEEQREAARVVTGELKSIDFAEHKVTIIYPPTSKELACIYQEDIEALLYERRRDLIQVTGRVVLDENGEPKQIIDVTDIRDLDLSPLVVDSLQFATLSLRASPTLVLEPSLDDTKQLLCVEDALLGLDVFAVTREKLVEEVHEQLWMLWVEYAQAPADQLNGRATGLKNALLARFTEVGHATQTA